jgi:hypothetical protein
MVLSAEQKIAKINSELAKHKEIYDNQLTKITRHYEDTERHYKTQIQMNADNLSRKLNILKMRYTFKVTYKQRLIENLQQRIVDGTR